MEITVVEPMLQERPVLTAPSGGHRPPSRRSRAVFVCFEPLAWVVVKIVDVKCPTLGQPDTFHSESLDRLNLEDEVKFVLSDRGDYEFARDFCGTSRSGPAGQGGPPPPAFSKGPEAPAIPPLAVTPAPELAEWDAGWMECRLGLQIHKLILFFPPFFFFLLFHSASSRAGSQQASGGIAGASGPLAEGR